jgi:probable HAF family extracellular repeat protein
MKDLGTLGGPDAFAPYINEHEEIAGFSYTSSTANPSGVPTIDPFLWEPPTRQNPNGTMIDLGTLGGTFGGEGDGVALNNEGQVVGASNLAGDSYFHPFLWTKPGPMQDLGTFGGNYGSAEAVNDVGEVAGWASNTGDQAILAFFWKDGVMTNLGTLPGDLCSYAHVIGSKHQVLGESDSDCNGGNYHGFLWESGDGMVDLNGLVTGADMTLGFPDYINDRGEISGVGLLANGDPHAYLLIPCDDAHPGIKGCDYRMVEASAAAAQASAAVRSEASRTQPHSLMRLMMGRFHLLGAALGSRN